MIINKNSAKFFPITVSCVREPHDETSEATVHELTGYGQPGETTLINPTTGERTNHRAILFVQNEEFETGLITTEYMIVTSTPDGKLIRMGERPHSIYEDHEWKDSDLIPFEYEISYKRKY